MYDNQHLVEQNEGSSSFEGVSGINFPTIKVGWQHNRNLWHNELSYAFSLLKLPETVMQFNSRYSIRNTHGHYGIHGLHWSFGRTLVRFTSGWSIQSFAGVAVAYNAQYRKGETKSMSASYQTRLKPTKDTLVSIQSERSLMSPILANASLELRFTRTFKSENSLSFFTGYRQGLIAIQELHGEIYDHILQKKFTHSGVTRGSGAYIGMAFGIKTGGT